jgi:hypothetical protein
VLDEPGMERALFGEVAVLAGVDAGELADAAAALREGEHCRVAVFVLGTDPAEAAAALEEFGSDQFGPRRVL